MQHEPPNLNLAGKRSCLQQAVVTVRRSFVMPGYVSTKVLDLTPGAYSYILGFGLEVQGCRFAVLALQSIDSLPRLPVREISGKEQRGLKLS